MDTYIDTINTYLEQNKPKGGCANITALLDVLYCCYSRRREIDPQSIRRKFNELDSILAVIPAKQRSRVVDLTCALCAEYGQAAFREGVIVGFRLFKELCMQAGEPTDCG